MGVPREVFGATSFKEICPSSWVSWSSYGLGLALAFSPAMAGELAAGGVGAAVLATSILLFFFSASMVQRYMKLSLLSSSYGLPKKLTTGGVFGVTRNPIYVAFVLPLLSIGYFSIPAALTASVVYVAAMTAFIIRREEEVLHHAFGAAYEAYAAKTPRWIFF